jgi:hypothetical protein
LLAALGGAAVYLPLAARAQQLGKLPTIGFLGGASWESQWAAPFVQRLHELSWTEGQTVVNLRIIPEREWGRPSSPFVIANVQLVSGNGKCAWRANRGPIE